jgi:hypothetical protein
VSIKFSTGKSEEKKIKITVLGDGVLGEMKFNFTREEIKIETVENNSVW